MMFSRTVKSGDPLDERAPNPDADREGRSTLDPTTTDPVSCPRAQGALRANMKRSHTPAPVPRQLALDLRAPAAGRRRRGLEHEQELRHWPPASDQKDPAVARLWKRIDVAVSVARVVTTIVSLLFPGP